jgi:hypothetical protein
MDRPPHGQDGVGESHSSDPRRVLSRLLSHGIHIGFFAGLHWVIRWVIQVTDQSHEWWAPIMVHGSAAVFVIEFFVTVGCELVADCTMAVRLMLRRLRNE